MTTDTTATETETPTPSADVELAPPPAPVVRPGALAGTDVPVGLQQMLNLAEVLAGSSTMPKHIKRASDVVAVMMLARSLDIPLHQAIAGTHIVDGRVGMYADLMRALILRAGHKLWIGDESSATEAVIYTKRLGEAEVRVTRYTIEEARTAKLLGKANWQAYPGDMLVSRCTTRTGRRYFGDVLMGMSYSPEELQERHEAVSAPQAVTTKAQRAEQGRARWLAAVDAAATAEAVDKLRQQARAQGLLDADLEGHTLRERLDARDADLAADVTDVEVLDDEPPADVDLDAPPPPSEPAGDVEWPTTRTPGGDA